MLYSLDWRNHNGHTSCSSKKFYDPNDQCVKVRMVTGIHLDVENKALRIPLLI